MNFKKVKDSQLELDKNQSEIFIEYTINNLFEFADLQSEITVKCYNDIVKPYLISLNLNPDEYSGYSLLFYEDSDSEIDLKKDGICLNNVKLEFQSEMWKKTNQFIQNKKYEKIIETMKVTNSYSNKISLRIMTYDIAYQILFNAKKSTIWKNNLTDKLLEHFFVSFFPHLINIKNQEKLKLNIISKANLIKIYYNGCFVHNFSYQIATNKKEIIDMLFNLKREIEYQINIKKKKL